ncbi:MAG: LON peptidase substrate-binding domain-containing protein, partial [Pirellulaceae bacterium]
MVPILVPIVAPASSPWLPIYRVTLVSDLSVRELPLFPLPDVVLFPQEVLPLHIFEPRYRMMLRTVMSEDRRFGVLRWDPQQQRMSSIGCCAEILHC